ncbi:MAPEG family protein [Sphingomonas mollis]|uniref:MAPEG family protein n=1 Tax=Sphingomonas mollis TaxID=2795726 RepID=A0ABS0XKP0_9SPHN|nr:MAPEG family protein [Sphingomonas sp. BT553]MBJ6120612.1 MAPEG family protein [Sphingomonas sp. BT553]
MILLHIMWPTFAMVALIFTTWSTMLVQRLGHLKRTPPSADDFATASATNRYFDGVDTAANNLRNLFEMPVLFFAIVPLLMGTRQAGIAQVLLAWIFVLLRAAHSRVHIGKGSLQARFRLYFASAIILSAMWIGFFVDFIRAAAAYSHATGMTF